ncbi:peptidoglycan recognition family protein [Paenibacillus sp. ACRRY]|uniref:peptidoglycan recognition protein family protein n=1 Tax=Paenibacillus sp. ACRRY TaxID=2918208 RepID=UPI001EF6F086|nr:peptidoglycan recognition family protein [Paenibacillus sp. ACRRY]MCG7385121.1 N-acetylmuramoyl-L-alanine amidase [Paenibacillus sp. ACRRY]
MLKKGNFLLMESSEFQGWLQQQKITRLINKLQVHHTWLPNYSTRRNQDHFKALEGIRNTHLANGWTGTGQNITVFEDGKIAISMDRDLNQTPAGIRGANTGALCVEIIGNFDVGGDRMTDEQKQAVLHLYACLAIKLNIPVNTNNIVYHAWYTASGQWIGDYVQGRSSKTCPGTNFFGDGNTRLAAAQGFIPAVKAEVMRIQMGGDEPMTESEKKRVDDLQATVDAQAKWIEAEKAKANMECPSWAKTAYEYYKPYIADSKGSYDFWRQLVINYRKEAGIKVQS